MKKIVSLTFLFAITILLAVNFSKLSFTSPDYKGKTTFDVKEKPAKFDGPDEFARFHIGIRTREGELAPAYRPGYKLIALSIAKEQARKLARTGARTKSNDVLAWTERGPANVPGRTRGLIVDPDDPLKNTWYAGSASGGIWKTLNAGQSWVLLTPNLSNLATTVLNMAASDHNIIYAGTGEGFFNVDAADGVGIFKSIDRGQTWQHLTSTKDFGDINRIAINPTNANIVLAACNDGIYRTANGGSTWTKVLTEVNIQDLKADPTNFSIQYASQRSVGIFKSINGGLTWIKFGTGLSPSGRMEIAISPVTPSRLFISAEGILSGTGSDLYVSDDSGAHWSLVDVSLENGPVDFLDEQGWYDNTIACHPFDNKIVYFGGVNLFRLLKGDNASPVASYSAQEINTSNFLTLVNFDATHYQGRLDVGSDATGISVEARFGPGKIQKAHRFLAPAGATSGVEAADYKYQNYVDVPFQVWDITNNRQLMASFRDQGRDGQFNLIASNTTSTIATEQSREYVYIHNINYSASPSSEITIDGGNEAKQMYFFWPVLADGGTWPPISPGTFKIEVDTLQKFNATTSFITDGRNEYGDPDKNDNLHVDHHNLVMIPMTSTTFKILNANDGGIFTSNTSANPGLTDNTWTSTNNGYNTSQFYGADKKPGANEYFGGMQDNGSWQSPVGEVASSTSIFKEQIGGDGFEALWNNLNSNMLIGSSQGNNFYRSINGGQTFASSTTGLSGEMPFISRLANSKSFPNRIFTVGESGVFVSANFGANWTLVPITENWGLTSFMDVEVSQANANIIWAGSGMSSNQKIHLSTDGGKSFKETNNYTLDMGPISKLASHPTEPNTAYALFSFAGAPKILRTTNVGQSWEDISGFGNGATSLNGFPDVAVYCLYVRPDNPDIIWAGTEIGIVESLDGGATWAILEDFQHVPVWDMKGQDDQIVLATHGRGIWTATIAMPQSNYVKMPEIIAQGTSPKKQFVLRIKSEEIFDSLEVYTNGVLNRSITNSITPGIFDLALGGLEPGDINMYLISYKNGAPYASPEYLFTFLDILTIKNNYSTYFNTTSDLTLENLNLQIFSGSAQTSRKNLHTLHNYAVSKRHSVLLRTPIRVSSTFPKLFYADIAIVEPDKDSVTVEATKNGLDWIELRQPYDASASSSWQTAYTNNQEGTRAMFLENELDISSYFSAGDTLLFRLQMASDMNTTAWGWAIDYITIQEQPLSNELSKTNKTTLTVYPNPSQGLLYLKFELQKPSDVTVKVVDMFGRSWLSESLGNKLIGEHTKEVNLDHLSDGTYLLLLNTSEGSEVAKIVRN